MRNLHQFKIVLAILYPDSWFYSYSDQLMCYIRLGPVPEEDALSGYDPGHICACHVSLVWAAAKFLALGPHYEF